MWMRKGHDEQSDWRPLAKDCSSRVEDGTVIALLLPKETGQQGLASVRPFSNARLPVELVYEVWSTRPGKSQLPPAGELRHPRKHEQTSAKKSRPESASAFRSPSRAANPNLRLDTGADPLSQRTGIRTSASGTGGGVTGSPRTYAARGSPHARGVRSESPMSPSAQRLKAWRERHTRKKGTSSPGPALSPSPAQNSPRPRSNSRPPLGSPHMNSHSSSNGSKNNSSPVHSPHAMKGLKSFGSGAPGNILAFDEADNEFDPALLDRGQLRSNNTRQSFSPRRGTPAEPIW